MKRAVERRFAARKGTEKGKGLYARASGCLCFACIKWVKDWEDATWFVARHHPERIAREARGGGRLVSRPWNKD